MDRSLPDDWLYDRMMLQLLETAGTIEANENRNSIVRGICLAQLGRVQSCSVSFSKQINGCVPNYNKSCQDRRFT